MISIKSNDKKILFLIPGKENSGFTKQKDHSAAWEHSFFICFLFFLSRAFAINLNFLEKIYDLHGKLMGKDPEDLVENYMKRNLK